MPNNRWRQVEKVRKKQHIESVNTFSKLTKAFQNLSETSKRVARTLSASLAFYSKGGKE